MSGWGGAGRKRGYEATAPIRYPIEDQRDADRLCFVSRPVAGSTVLVDWRARAVPDEPTRIRPAAVVETHELFSDEYPQYHCDSSDSR